MRYRSKKIIALVFALCVVCVLSVSAFATDSGNGTIAGVETAVEQGLTETAGSLMTVIQTITPIAIGVAAAVMVITLGIKVFMRVTGARR